MIKKPALFTALTLASATTSAHEGLALSGTLHRFLHWAGSDGLLVTGGTLLAMVVGLLVRREARKAARGSRHEA